MKKSIKKIANAERRRLMSMLSQAKPGSDEYEKLQKEIFKLEEIEEKRLDGHIKPKDVFGAALTVVTTGAVITADSWIPSVNRYLHLEDFVKKLFK